MFGFYVTVLQDHVPVVLWQVNFFVALSSPSRASIVQVRGFFSKLNQVYKDYIEAENYFTQVGACFHARNLSQLHSFYVVITGN